MAKARCDICGAEGQQAELLERYQVDGIKDVCYKCKCDLNDHLRRLKNLEFNFLTRVFQSWIRDYKRKKSPEPLTKEQSQRDERLQK